MSAEERLQAQWRGKNPLSVCDYIGLNDKVEDLLVFPQIVVVTELLCFRRRESCIVFASETRNKGFVFSHKKSSNRHLSAVFLNGL